MKINNANEISFQGVYQNGGTLYSNIIFKGNIIGSLTEQQTSILNPIIEKYSILSTIDNKNDFDGFIESEDEGNIFGYFTTLEKFIKYYNSIN
ncbi:MAG: hypothetical protein E6R13_04475 [Spirochaetes bacterium]|nr:MAG: hypothetical protein E6R13_04475 [Spirochaetota bacterium]